MSAYEIPSLRFSAEASAIVNRRRFVKFDANGKALQAAAGEAAVGVSTNSTAIGEVLEIADGIVMVEAGGVIAANAVVQADANGKAVTRTTGYALGTALTGAAGAGELIAVKTPGVGIGGNLTTIVADVANLAAGADVADVPFYVVPAGYRLTIKSVDVVSLGNPAGIDDANTCVVLVEEGATKIADKTYDTANAFPAGGAADTLTLVGAAAVRAAGDVLTYSVTNGATADPAAFAIQITGLLEAV
jgi:hypothetical protein